MRKFLVSTLASLALSALAPCQDPAGATITLKNGDKLSGTISSVTADEVVIDTPATGQIKVALGEVANITSASSIDLSTEDGERLSGPIQGYADGKLRIGSGAAVRDVPATALVTYRPPVEWTGTISVGGTLSTGNTERRAANAQAQAIRRSDDTRLTLRASWDYGEQKSRGDFDNDPSTPPTLGDWELAQRRSFGSAKFDYFLNDELYAFVQSTAENDRLADLELRFTGGGGLGYMLVDNETFMLQGEAGVTYIDERRYTPGADSDNIAARLAYSLRWNISDDTRFLQDGEFYPSLEDQEDFYARVDSRLQTSLTDEMFAQLQYILDYDSTPSPGFERDDHRFIVSIGWGF
jgi:putative salt-induced outer membrane protein YdiY